MRSGVAEILVAGKQVRAKMNHKTKHKNSKHFNNVRTVRRMIITVSNMDQTTTCCYKFPAYMIY